MNFTNARNSKSSAFVLLLAALTLCACDRGKTLRAATPSPAPSPALAASPSPAAAETPPRYDGAQQSQYISTANTAFMAARRLKFQAFVDARAAFEAAGGNSPKGLTSKEALTSRRDLLNKVRAANDDYVAFLATQNDAYKAELQKTRLVATDIDALVATFAANPGTVREVKRQQIEQELLTADDEMLGDLEKWDGSWSVNPAGKLLFKKKANTAAYSDAEHKYNAAVGELQKLQAETAPAASPSPSPATVPAASPAATP